MVWTPGMRVFYASVAFLVVSVLLASFTSAWLDSNWGLRKPLVVSEGQGSERFQEPFVINVTGLSLATSNCTKELRVSANYSVETALEFEVLNASGQTEAVGSQWCLIKFLVNMTTTRNASYVERNATNYWVYYDNAAATTPGYSQLSAWTYSYNGDVDPLTEGWRKTSVIETCDSYYSYVNSEGSIANFNDTGTSSPSLCSYQRWQGADQPNYNENSTAEIRMRVLSADGSGSGGVYAGVGVTFMDGATNQFQGGANDSAAGVGDLGNLPGIHNNYYASASTDQFHVYRVVADLNSNYTSFWEDGVHKFTISNMTIHGDLNDTSFGENSLNYGDKINFEVDYLAVWVNGSLAPPLSNSLGAEESGGGGSIPTTWLNYSWLNRQCFTVTDGWNTERYDYPVLVNVTNMSLTTDNCTKELRVSAVYSSETELEFGSGYQISNNSGEGFGNGSKYCGVLVLLNQTTTRNSTYTQRNSTSFCVYYNADAVVTPPTFANRSSDGVWWSGNSHVPWTGSSQLTQTIMGVDGNSVLNETGFGANPFGYNNSASGGTLNDNAVGTTQVWRVKVTKTNLELHVGFNDGTRIESMRLYAGNVSQAFWDNGNAVTNGAAATLNDNYHVITHATQGNDYSIFVDGVNKTWGSNYTGTGGTSDQTQIGNSFQPAGVDFELLIDFYRVVAGVKPPLSAASNGVEGGSINITVFSPTNGTGYNNSYVVSNFTVEGGFSEYNCTEWFDGSRTWLGYVANSTFNWSNHSIPLFTNYNYTLFCENSTYSLEREVYFYRYINRLIVFAFDEGTGTQIQAGFANVNSSNYTSVTNAWYFNQTSNETATGEVTIYVNASGYHNRTYYADFGDSSITLNTYLLNASTSSTIFVRFHVLNGAYGTVSNALVNVTRLVGGVPESVAQAYTDSFGVASFYLDSTASYTIYVSHDDYGSEVLTVVPVLNDYTIVLSGGAYSVPSNCYANLTVFGWPTNNKLLIGSSNLTLSIASLDSNLAYFGWNLSYGSTLLNFTNITSLSGGSTLGQPITFSASNATGNVSLVAWWSFVNSSECYATRFWFVYNVSGLTGLSGTLATIRYNTGLGDTGFSIIALLITMVSMAFAASFTTAGGPVVGVLVAGFFFFTGWLTPLMFALLFFVGLVWGYFAFSRGY